MHWTLLDFVTFGGMVAAAGLPLAIALFRGPTLAYRAGALIAVGASFLMVWVSLAVGIIGEPDNPGNLMFAAALAIAFIGSGLARFHARGMAQALFAAAIALAFVPIIALPLKLGVGSNHWPLDVLVLSGFFAAAYALAAWLFHLSARSNSARAAA